MKPAQPVSWALAYARHDLNIFPCAPNKQPLTANGFKDATYNLAVIEDWWRRWPHADPAWALPSTVVVVDIDIKNGRNGYRDFERLNGCDPHAVETPTASTPSGGLQLFFAASRPYRNRVAIDGTGLDTRTTGGYCVLPGPDNGRRWLKPLRGAPMAEAPAWLDCAPRQAPAAAIFRRPRGRGEARVALQRACAKIAAAPDGAQDATRHRECFRIGTLIAHGDLDYGTALSALIAASRSMPAYRKPWRDFEERVEASIARGMGRAAP
ncbi:MAG TPA: bifunctional DNA primase/polymerase [Roseiarcus sp.]